MPNRMALMREKQSPIALRDLFGTSIRRKIAYLLLVSAYATGASSLALGLFSGWDKLLQLLPLLVLVPLVVAIPVCFLTVHREIANEDLTRRLREALAHDPLTRAKTRQILYERFNSNTDRRAIVMIDVDHFKRINDTHGHLVGDQVLRGVADSARLQIRGEDLLCRFGGEEFAVLLVDAAPEEALQISNRICTSLSETPIVTSAGPVKVTVSIGLTAVDPFEDIGTALSRADEALYRAKERGRNRTELACRTLAPRLGFA
ncbi:GGDEF domain-containing protein [Salipiger sp. IMCC34102]|uniref:GGDEF domain-containing protein n=1 Tax=Salipiger sp. IMCC34102 TaxID=2510647 RepID=UPI00101D1042|nr:GGDEF domain-containing protein [Salipiger sp. IMCC34102]RYH03803.1 GGDEF domain-containing protein [Salipiger sp. IMCC34102]